MDRDGRQRVGARVREARRHAGLTQKQLADVLGVTTRTVQNYEAGVAVPYKHLRAIESLGRKRPGWILDGGENADLVTTITELREAMARHQTLMQSHVEELRRSTTQLREQVRRARTRE